MSFSMINVGFQKQTQVPGPGHRAVGVECRTRQSEHGESHEPSTDREVRGLLGMINHLGTFLPYLAEKTHPYPWVSP